MQITNGTVSRTVKPADYEGRTVTLSFTVDPGDEVELALMQLSFLCEKHARHTPSVQATDAAPVAIVPAAGPAPADAAPRPRGRTAAPRPPVVESVARVEPAASAAPTVQAEPGPTLPASVAPATAAPSSLGITLASGTAAPSDTGPTATAIASPSDRDITTDDLNRAIGLARKIWQVPGEQVEQVRNAATGVAGMSIFAPEATQDMKRAFLAGIEALNPNAAQSGEKY